MPVCCVAKIERNTQEEGGRRVTEAHEGGTTLVGDNISMCVLYVYIYTCMYISSAVWRHHFFFQDVVLNDASWRMGVWTPYEKKNPFFFQDVGFSRCRNSNNSTYDITYTAYLLSIFIFMQHQVMRKALCLHRTP